MADLATSDPKILMGKPVIAGTRIPVKLILEKLAAGETVEQIIPVPPAPHRGRNSGGPRVCRESHSG